MDDIDKNIISYLREDSRTPYINIAKQLNVSEGTIRNRVKELQKNGGIKRFTIESDNDTFAIVGIKTETKKQTSNISDIIKSKGATKLYEVTGRFDILAMIPTKEMKLINSMLESIRTIEGVEHTETFMILESK